MEGMKAGQGEPPASPGRALNQVGWGFHGEPKDCPVFRLVDGNGVLGILAVSRDEVPADKPWAIRAELDALEDNVRLESLVVRDAQDNLPRVSTRLRAAAPRRSGRAAGLALARAPAGRRAPRLE
jgi:hypothetical protein